MLTYYNDAAQAGNNPYMLALWDEYYSKVGYPPGAGPPMQALPGLQGMPAIQDCSSFMQQPPAPALAPMQPGFRPPSAMPPMLPPASTPPMGASPRSPVTPKKSAKSFGDLVSEAQRKPTPRGSSFTNMDLSPMPTPTCTPRGGEPLAIEDARPGSGGSYAPPNADSFAVRPSSRGSNAPPGSGGSCVRPGSDGSTSVRPETGDSAISYLSSAQQSERPSSSSSEAGPKAQHRSEGTQSRSINKSAESPGRSANKLPEAAQPPTIPEDGPCNDPVPDHRIQDASMDHSVPKTIDESAASLSARSCKSDDEGSFALSESSAGAQSPVCD